MMNNEEPDFDRAIDDANKIIVPGSTMKTGLFSSLTIKKDIPSLTRELGYDGRTLYVVLEALWAIGYLETKKYRYMITERARPLLREGGKGHPGGYLPHALNKLNTYMEK